ncbi:MAG: flagellin [Opitutae bacterium]|nr:flagellin [Opitutae bacterium]
MPIVVNSNTTATTASFNLSRANDALRKSLARLSSGNRIVNPADDAGSMAVAYKLNSKLKRTEAVRQNIQNGISYLQVQDGALGVVAKILTRISELRTMSMDVTKNSGDVENYSKEFVELQQQLNQVRHQKFNGISLFAINDQVASDFNPESQLVKISDDGGSLRYRNSSDTSAVATYDKYAFELMTSPSGKDTDGSISLNVINYEFMLSLGSVADFNLAGIGNARVTATNTPTAPGTIALNGHNFIADISKVSIHDITMAIEKLADLRAENGAEQNRLGMASELLVQNQTNLEAAYGRIMDADIALESTRMARQNVLVQSSAAMVAQANQLTSIALTVLG